MAETPATAHGQPATVAAVATGAAQAADEEAEIVRELTRIRGDHLAYWRELGSGGVVGLERFAATVQRVVDVRAAEGAEEWARAALDDLVDLFVGPGYELEKALVMSTPAVLGDDALSEHEADRAGFAPELQAGEGRMRHFALSAAASYAAPDALVELAARLRGGDLRVDSPDSQADVATNSIGRDFASLLREQPRSRLGDGRTVREWIVERFAGGQPEL